MKIGIYALVVVKQKKQLLRLGIVDVKVLLRVRIIINFVEKQAIIIIPVENVTQKCISPQVLLQVPQNVVRQAARIVGITIKK